MYGIFMVIYRKIFQSHGAKFGMYMFGRYTPGRILIGKSGLKGRPRFGFSEGNVLTGRDGFFLAEKTP